MSYGIKLKVWGEHALFTRPEMKVERVSYDVMTPSAARGILEAIYWKPQIRWVIDRIHVLKPIQFTHIRRNEIDQKIPANNISAAMKGGSKDLGLAVDQHRQQRASMLLRDVCYGIEAHVEVLDPTDQDQAILDKPEAKHLEMFKRRASKGQYFHHPYLGTRECLADFELVDSFEAERADLPDALRGPRDLGFMLHDIDFIPDKKGPIVESNRGQKRRAEPRFFRAEMVDGVIEVPPFEKARA